jgi:hypothetical protein
MIDISRRHFVSLALAALPAAWLLRLSPAYAQQAFRRFFPFLVDLDGWEGHTPDGMSMEMGNSSMLTATREYRRGPARVNVGVVMGPAAVGALAAGAAGMNIETTEGHMITSTIDGFTVIRTYNIKEKSGAVMVKLARPRCSAFRTMASPRTRPCRFQKSLTGRASRRRRRHKVASGGATKLAKTSGHIGIVAGPLTVAAMTFNTTPET